MPSDIRVFKTRLLAFDGTSKAGFWRDPLRAEIDNDCAPQPDIFDFGAGNLVLHGKSWELLKPRLEKFCEFLPVRWEGGNGQVVNVLGCSDCLDSEKTTWILGRESGKRIRIERYAFSSEKVPENFIFKIPERPFELFCTSAFRDLIDQNSIKGICFSAVWPEI